MKLLIIFAISAVLLQYHFAVTTHPGPGWNEHTNQKSPIQLPKELSNYQLNGYYNDGGSVSDVELAKNKETEKEVVIKITSKINTKRAGAQHMIEDIIKMARREADILKHLPHHPHHPNIVQFEKFVETNENVYLVMECASGSDGFEYLHVKKLDENTARIIFKQVFDAIKHCHEHEIVHGDLKTENVLIDINNNTKLIDFGFAYKLKQGELSREYSCTRIFSAPEIKIAEKRGSKFDGFKSDIWTLGVFLYELVCGSVWSDTDTLVDRILLGHEPVIYPSYVKVTEDVKDLIRNILKIDPDKRYTLQQIMDHKWMKMGGSNTQSG